MSLAESRAGSRFGSHSVPFRPYPHPRFQQWISLVLAPLARSCANRIYAGLHLQHRVAGQVPSLAMGNSRSTGAMARADARPEPFPCCTLGAGLFALVLLCFCNHVSPAPAGIGPSVAITHPLPPVANP